MSYDINKANREDGSWVEGVCPYRAVPCKNPICVDEAMRSGEIRVPGDRIARISSDHAFKRATSRVKECEEEGLDCPLGPLESRLNLLSNLKIKFNSVYDTCED